MTKKACPWFNKYIKAKKKSLCLVKFGDILRLRFRWRDYNTHIFHAFVSLIQLSLSSPRMKVWDVVRWLSVPRMDLYPSFSSFWFSDSSLRPRLFRSLSPGPKGQPCFDYRVSILMPRPLTPLRAKQPCVCPLSLSLTEVCSSCWAPPTTPHTMLQASRCPLIVTVV